MASVVKNTTTPIPVSEEESIAIVSKESFASREMKIPANSGAETESAHKEEVTANWQKEKCKEEEKVEEALLYPNTTPQRKKKTKLVRMNKLRVFTWLMIKPSKR